MKKETKQQIKETIQMLLISLVCIAFVLSLHGGNKKSVQETEPKKVQELKNDTINIFKLEQRVR